jgi:hypothetical protein
MRMHFRRTGIVLLVPALLTSLLSTTQAGVIPWLYDAIFGPVYPHHYGGYGSGLSGYGCAPAPCNPCRVGYAPRSAMTLSSAACASGACSTTAFYGPCGKTCSTTVACTGTSETQVGKLAPEPADLPPAAKTMDDAPVPDPARLDLEHSKPSVSGVAAPDDTSVKDDPGFNVDTRGEDSSDVFAPPVVRPEGSATEDPAPTVPEALDSTLGLDSRTSWSVPVSKQRTGMRSSFRNARIARHARPIDHNYVIPPQSSVRVAGR